MFFFTNIINPQFFAQYFYYFMISIKVWIYFSFQHHLKYSYYGCVHRKNIRDKSTACKKKLSVKMYLKSWSSIPRSM